MQYADYQFYTENYHGDTVDSAKFNHYAVKASALINHYTSGKAQALSPVPDSVKMAMCAIVDDMFGFDTGAKGIISESVGRVSRSYSTTKTDQATFYETALLYLSETGLMGAMIGHDYKL